MASFYNVNPFTDDVDSDDDIDNLSSNVSDSSSCNYIEESKLNEFFDFKKECQKQSLKLMHINCRSLKKNYTAINDLIATVDDRLTALAVTETWLSNANKDSVDLVGYEFISNNRQDKSGGGVGIYINIDVNYVVRHELTRMSTYLECIFIEMVVVGGKNILLGCVYRPPNSDVNEFNRELELLLQTCDTKKGQYILVAGDFNLDLLNSNNHHPTLTFLNIMSSHSLLPSILIPTRITTSSATLIDNIFTNCISNNLRSAIIQTDISDHFPIAIHFNTGKNLSSGRLMKYICKRIYNVDSIKEFNNELATTDWAPVYKIIAEDNNPNVAYNSFANTYKIVFDKHFPVKRCKSSKTTPRTEWITKGLIKSSLTKAMLYKKYCNNRTTLNFEKYTKFRNIFRTLIRKAERAYYSGKFDEVKGNIKETWMVIRQVLKSKAKPMLSDQFIFDGIITDNKLEIINKLNEYFTTVGSELASSITPPSKPFTDYLSDPNPRSFSLFPIDPNEILNIGSDICNKSSCGHDEIPVFILKSSLPFIAYPLSQLINSSFECGIFPDALKIGKLCPIFKNGDKKLSSNYRPISVLPSISKIYERAIKNRLSTFLEQDSILIRNQFGFRKNYSTYMPIMDLYDKISSAIDNNEYAVTIFIDLAKAFDTIDYSVLFSKLYHYGIRGVTLDLFKSYLNNRKQFVHSYGLSSSYKTVTCGVPQGSVLGPLLFILYINDIVKSSNILRMLLFADDTTLFHSDKNFVNLINTTNVELDKLAVWFRANKLSLNVKKTIICYLDISCVLILLLITWCYIITF
jgi:endonuclease/exonuclease/phosphatase family metal-dependent hydrolase